MNFRTLILFFSVFILTTSFKFQSGRSFFVSPTGSNSGTGSISSPFKDLSFAITKAGAGDTIFMRGGTHFVSEVYVDRRKGHGGREGAYLTIKAYEDETPKLQGISRRLIVKADFVRIEGLTIVFRTGSQPAEGWYFDVFGFGNQIVNNKFSGGQPKFGAILAGGNNCLYEGNDIKIEAGGNTRDHGIYIKSGRGSIVRGNTIEGSQGYGIHVFEDGLDGSPLIADLTVENNTVKGSRTRSGLILATQRTGRIEGVSITGNRFENNKDFGVLVRTGKDINVTNNVFVNDKMRVEPAVINFTESGNTFNGGGGEPPAPVPPPSEGLRFATENIPDGKVGELYGVVIRATGGVEPYSFSTTAPLSEFGLRLLSSGDLLGTPTKSGEFMLGVRVTDARGAEFTSFFAWHIARETSPPPVPPPTPVAGDTLELDFSKIEKVLIIMKSEK